MDLPRELHDAICNDPEDRALRRVAADWLSGHGDPRGDLIALALEYDAGNSALAEPLDALQAQLDPFTGDGWIVDWRWGYVRRAARFGFVGDDPLRAWRSFFASDAAQFTHELSYPLAGELLHDTLLERPARAVRALVTNAGHRIDEVIAALPYLTRLHAHDIRTPLRSSVLRELALSGYQFDWLTEIELPALQRLRIQLPPAEAATFRFDVLARLPRLRELVVETSAVDEIAAALRVQDGIERLDSIEVIGRGATPRRVFVVDRTPPAGIPIGLLVVRTTNTTAPELAAGALFTSRRSARMRLHARRGFGVDLAVDTTLRDKIRLEYRDHRWYVDPYASLNGTFVRRCELHHGDTLQLGNTELVVLTHDLEASARRLRAEHGLPARRTVRR